MTFRLEASFLSGYEGRPAPFGFRDINGTSLGEITFIRTYSRLKDDGTKETWQDVCQRVIEGMYEIQRRHCERYTLPWDTTKAQRSAQEAYDHLFNLRWTPSGRGLWAMGTPLVMSGNSAPLQSCAFVSTDGLAGDDPGDCFAWMMEASMLGIGVGFDDAGAHKDVRVKAPQGEVITFVVPDTREGWAQSLRLLIESYLTEDDRVVYFDYSEARPAGSPIRTFGGTASGPEPLRVLHERVRGVLDRASESGRLDVESIADIGNMIGVCVVAGNVRRSSEIFLGSADDETFLSLKDYNSEIGKRRTGWSHLSNNSVIANVDDDLSHLAPRILENGEPGVIFLDKARQFGRLADPRNDRDARVRGTNPCGEIGLEDRELCNLVETFPGNCKNFNQYERVLKFAYLYAKTVTLLPTPWPKTNAVMMRNRRIGTSMSGLADFVDKRGWELLTVWQDLGYDVLKKYDNIYSEWLAIRDSVKVSTVKPSGSVSLLAGVSPGVHWQPGSKFYWRAVRFSVNDPILKQARESGYRIESCKMDPVGTAIVFFPMERQSPRGEHDVSLQEKLDLAAMSQRWWSDNMVSATFSYSNRERGDIPQALRFAADRLKGASFLPLSDHGYEQAPYTPATLEELEELGAALPIDTTVLYAGGVEAIGETGCTTDVCEIK